MKIFGKQAEFENFQHENRNSEDFKIPQNPQFHFFARKSLQQTKFQSNDSSTHLTNTENRKNSKPGDFEEKK